MSQVSNGASGWPSASGSKSKSNQVLTDPDPDPDPDSDENAWSVRGEASLRMKPDTGTAIHQRIARVHDVIPVDVLAAQARRGLCSRCPVVCEGAVHGLYLHLRRRLDTASAVL
jgi:hypothetical protein